MSTGHFQTFLKQNMHQTSGGPLKASQTQSLRHTDVKTTVLPSFSAIFPGNLAIAAGM